MRKFIVFSDQFLMSIMAIKTLKILIKEKEIIDLNLLSPFLILEK